MNSDDKSAETQDSLLKDMRYMPCLQQAYRLFMPIQLFMYMLFSCLCACQFTTSQKELKEAFAQSESEDQSRIIPWKEYRTDWKPQKTAPKLPLRYVATGRLDGPILLFVHGSPGNLGGWLDYLKDARLRQRFALLAPDRPGYGESARGHPISSLSKQARALYTLLTDFQSRHPGMQSSPKRPVFLMGHSLGGPIVLRFALDYPEILSGIILVASPADPGLEEWAWYNRLAETSLVRLLLPVDWDTSNQELKPLRSELQDIQDRYREIHLPVLLIHGQEDSLVPFENAAFLRKHLSEVPRLVYETPPDEDHFVVWSKRAWIIQRILNFVKEG